MSSREFQELEIGKFTIWKSGGTPSKSNPEYWGGNIPWISAKNFKNLRISTSEIMITEKGLKQGSKLASVGSILLLVRGSGLFNDIPIGIVEKQVAYNQDLKSIEVDENIILPEYFYFWLRSNKQTLSELLEHTSIGAGKFDINRLKLLKVKIPNKVEQRKVINIIKMLDDKIELNKKINDNLAQQAQAIFKSWFIDFAPYSNDKFKRTELGEIPSEWRIGTFKELIEKTLAGDWGKEFSTGNNTKEVYCIRGADIPEVKIGNKGKMPVRFILPKNYETKRLEPNDIIVEISGGSPTQSTGRVAVITKALLNRYDKGMVCTNFCKAITPIQAYSLFVYFYWQYLYDKNVMFSYENGTTGIKNFDINGFFEYEKIVIPPKKDVESFNELISPLFAMLFANGLESEKLEEIRDFLLPKLMLGEIDVSNIHL